MGLLPDLINAALVSLVGIVLTYGIRDRFRHQEELDKARQEVLPAQHEAIRSEMESRFEGLDRQFASVRSDLTQIALAVGAQPRPQAG